MASYNFTRAADRARCRADRQAEIDAADAGTWPRDINDQFRWVGARPSPYLSAAEHWRVMAEHARACCQWEIAYLLGLDQRSAADDDPSLTGWEAAC